MTAFGAAVGLIILLGAIWYVLSLYERERYARASNERREAGFTPGRTLELDSRVLYSERLGLAGKPDRIVRQNGIPIPEEWKSGTRVYPSHRAQLAVYLILVEEEYGVRPPHGVIVLGDGQREVVRNSDQLRNWALGVADQIREARRRVDEPIQVSPTAAQCRACGMRGNCGQARG